MYHMRLIQRVTHKQTTHTHTHAYTHAQTLSVLFTCPHLVVCPDPGLQLYNISFVFFNPLKVMVAPFFIVQAFLNLLYL